mgnify:CR=1 FL=1
MKAMQRAVTARHVAAGNRQWLSMAKLLSALSILSLTCNSPIQCCYRAVTRNLLDLTQDATFLQLRIRKPRAVEVGLSTQPSISPY